MRTPGCRAGGADEHLVEPEAPLRQRAPLRMSARREGGRGGEAEAVVPDRRERAPADGVTQPEAPEHRHASRHNPFPTSPPHDPFAAGLLAGKTPGLEHVDAQAGPSQQDRQRRPRRPTARHDDVNGIHGGYHHRKGKGKGKARE